ncbi:MAG: vitamin B12-dependent ribonucleotide reductase, partial [Acidimicrobiales bacterium]|nr:vitamin B12-dependent ribonucleotide reductase [Acidimicrobiales bacterium]
AFAISVSHGLQYGVPLRSYVKALIGMRFEPAGMTDDPDIRIASSLMDYLFRRLAVEYFDPVERAGLGIFTTGERVQPTLPGVEETATPTRQGADVAPDPPSIPSAAELAASVSRQIAPETAAYETESMRSAPLCMQCGEQMQRAGSCYACHTCGNTSGCS